MDATFVDENEEIQRMNEEFPAMMAGFLEFYSAILFLVCLFVAGDVICDHLLKRLVSPIAGYILVGIIFGPCVLKKLTYTQTWCQLGNLGLALYICQRGLQFDLFLKTEKEDIVKFGFLVLLGSAFPFIIGFCIALLVLHQDVSTAVFIGYTFVPTSSRIASNVLRPLGLWKKSAGLIIKKYGSLNDVVGLILLGQLQLFREDQESEVFFVVVYILSPIFWLVLGSLVSVKNIMPKTFAQLYAHWTETTNRITFIPSADRQERIATNRNQSKRGSVMNLIIVMVGLMPATFYSESSFLMGAFLAGLSFSSLSNVAKEFKRQYKPIIMWLMRIFYATTIGFHIQITLFDREVIFHGLLLSTAILIGKLWVGPFSVLTMMMPWSNHGTKEKIIQRIGNILLVGFGAAGEAEFALLIAILGHASGVLSTNLFSSILIAILTASLILSPILMRLTIWILFPRIEKEAEYLGDEAEIINRGAVGNTGEERISLSEEDELRARTTMGITLPEQRQQSNGIAANAKMLRTLIALNPDMINSPNNKNNNRSQLSELCILGHEDDRDCHMLPQCYLLIRTKSVAPNGGIPLVLRTMIRLKLEIIDHKSWRERDIDHFAPKTTQWLLNELIVMDKSRVPNVSHYGMLHRLEQIKSFILDAINHIDTTVLVQEWIPGSIATGVFPELKESAASMDDREAITAFENAVVEASTFLSKRHEARIHAQQEAKRWLNDKMLPNALVIHEEEGSRDSESSSICSSIGDDEELPSDGEFSI